jgi:hypothetical protein
MGKASKAKRERRSGILRITPSEKLIGPVPPDVLEVFGDQRRKFIEKFGREPGPEDPIFFDPRADTPQPFKIQEEDEREILAAMTQAGLDPALIHAYQKTGRLVTEENKRFLTQDELREWRAAVEEGKKLSKPH